MNCLQYRKQLLSAPRSLTSEMVAHRVVCAQCAAFTGRIEDVESALTEAVLVQPPEDLANRILLRRSLADTPPVGPARRRFLALAASVAIATTGLGAFLFWRHSGQEEMLESSLARELVAHLLMAHPPGLGAAAHGVAEPEVSGLLKRAGFAARVSLDRVANGWPCVFREQPIAHLVLESDAEPVTALVLPLTLARRAHRFAGPDLYGVIAPCAHGTLALLVQSRTALDADLDAELDRIATRFQDAIVSA